jgi:hypothetical protein
MTKSADGDKTDKKTLEVEVFSPNEVEGKDFSFDKHLTVGEAAEQAANAFGYAPGGKPSFAKDQVALERGKQLVAAGVRDGDKLDLVDVGGGV